MADKKIDFKKALRTGLAANEDAMAKRAEIESVVDELSRQLSEETRDVLGAKLESGTRQFVKNLTGIAAALSGNEREVRNVEYTSLVAFRKSGHAASTELADFSIAPTGYPVAISSPGVHQSVNDRESLERALAFLLGHPDTGGKIKKLLATIPPAETISEE